MPGSHHGKVGPTPAYNFPGHPDRYLDRGVAGVSCGGSAGTIAVHHQSICHRRAAITAPAPRHLIKFSVWRTTPPARNWVREEGFDLRACYYGGLQSGSGRYAAQALFWLWGREQDYRIIGGEAWPSVSENQIHPSWGFPGPPGPGSHYDREGYQPDWRREQEGYYYVSPRAAPRL